MTTSICGSHTKWSGSRDENGHREWKITYQVQCDALDGPSSALATPGLPLPGALWLIDNDSDIWAWCRWNVNIEPRSSDGSPNTLFDLEFTFSTQADLKSCREFQFEDPILEPQKISGGFNRYQEEAVTDRFGIPILSSSFEQIRGPQVEFDANRIIINIEQNVPALQLPLLNAMQDTLNDRPLWGVPARCIKLNVRGWEKKFYGSCYIYYTRQFEFEVRRDGFDRYLLDEGTKALSGRWNNTTGTWTLVNIAGAAPDPLNPQHFVKYTDKYGNATKTLLNGRGLPALAVVESTSGYYISIDTPNIGQALTNRSFWIPVYGTPGSVPWQGGTVYRRGEIVSSVSGDYVAAPVSPVNTIAANVAPPAAPWVFLNDFSDAGQYDDGIVYDIGQFVYEDTSTRTTQGFLGIQKYNESNFLFLGIPVII